MNYNVNVDACLEMSTGDRLMTQMEEFFRSAGIPGCREMEEVRRAISRVYPSESPFSIKASPRFVGPAQARWLGYLRTKTTCYLLCIRAREEFLVAKNAKNAITQQARQAVSFPLLAQLNSHPRLFCPSPRSSSGCQVAAGALPIWFRVPC